MQVGRFYLVHTHKATLNTNIWVLSNHIDLARENCNIYHCDECAYVFSILGQVFSDTLKYVWYHNLDLCCATIEALIIHVFIVKILLNCTKCPSSEGTSSINLGIMKVMSTQIFVILTRYCHIGSQRGRPCNEEGVWGVGPSQNTNVI